MFASDGVFGDKFGVSVSIDGDYALIGADGDDDNNLSSGSAYVFIKLNIHPPTPPFITGPPSGRAGKEYCWEFHSNDPDGDNIKYIIDWGDGNTTETECEDPCTNVTECHTYTKRGNYTITAIAIECTEYGLESEESTYVITIPRNRATNTSCWLKFFDMFPILQGLIQILGH